MTGAEVTISIRRSDDRVDVSDLRDLRVRQFDTAVPWREFRWYRKQRHFSGSYWSATMEAPVGYESRLEYANLLLADFDPRVVWILSQPFLVDGDDRGTARRHVPDYLFIHADDSACVVDVKPAEKLSRPKVHNSLAWSRRIIEGHGWEYRVQSEPDPVLLANVQFLAGYRRRFQFPDAEVVAATGTLHTPLTLGEAVRAVAPIEGDLRLARSLVLHLLWVRHLNADLTRPLSSASLLTPSCREDQSG